MSRLIASTSAPLGSLMRGAERIESGAMTTRVLLGLHTQIAEMARQCVSPEFALTSLELRRALASDYDLYLPLTLADYEVLEQCNDAQFFDRAIVPARSAIETCDDKLAFAEAIEQAGLQQYLPERLSRPASAPYVLKKRRGAFGCGTTVVTSDLASDIANRLAPGEYFIQELIVGDIEYATHLLMSNGCLLYHFTARFQMATDRTIKGAASNGEYVGHSDAAPHLPILVRLLDTVGFTDGVCCVDYKLVNGKPRVFEINPRFGGSLTMDITRFLRAYRSAVYKRQQICVG